MDPRTVLIVVTAMMLLNGGVLGLMHRDLAPEVRHSARDWRIGTLLAAAGCLLLAVQDALPLAFASPLANGCLMMSIVLYLRAVRRFDGKPDTVWVFLPVPLGVLGIYWASAITPSVSMRTVVASIAWLIPLGIMAYSLHVGGRLEASANRTASWQKASANSRNVLIAMVLVVGVYMGARAVYFMVHPQYPASLLAGGQWISTATLLIPSALPIIGTTVFIMMCSDRLGAQLMRAASTDYLTGLPNRRTISEIAARNLIAAHRLSKQLPLALIDIDHFKQINDTYGHDVGDEALKHVATTLSQQCTSEGNQSIVARQGGEEFLVLLIPSDGDIKAHAEQLRQALENNPFKHEGASIKITISIGVALTRANETQVTHAMRRSDEALYAAKEGGRNRVIIAP